MTFRDKVQEVEVSLMRAKCLADDAAMSSMKPPEFSDLELHIEAAYRAVMACLAWTPTKKK